MSDLHSVGRFLRRAALGGLSASTGRDSQRARGRPVRLGGRFVAAVLCSLLAGTLATGTLAQVRWGDRGLEMSPLFAVATGVVLFASVAAAVISLTSRRDRSSDGATPDGAIVDGDGEGVAPTASILTGDATEDARTALVRDADGEWTWRVLHLEALATSGAGADTQAAATERIERTHAAIADANRRTVTGPTIRLYETRDGTWQWSLVRADGSRVGTGTGSYDDVDAAAAAVSVLTDCGPSADLCDVERAAFALAERDGRWHWELVDDDRTTLAASAGGYATRAEADAATETFAALIAQARVLDVEDVGVELLERGARTDRAGDENVRADSDETEDADEEWTWRLVDGADDVVADATVAVDTRAAAENAATAALDALDDAAVTVAGEPAYERHPDDGEWHWRLIDEAGRVLARAPAGSSIAGDAATDRFRETAPDADMFETPESAYEVVPAVERGETDGVAVASGGDTRTESAPDEATAVADGSGSRPGTETEGGTRTGTGTGTGIGTEDAGDGWRWRLVTAERDVLALGSVVYEDAAAATAALERIRTQASGADVVAFETAAFRVYEDAGDGWRWRLLDEGGDVLADSDAAHDSRNEAIEAMLTFQERAPEADVTEVDAAAFEVFGTDGEWSWRLIDDAGTCVAESPTSSPSRDAVRAAIDRLDDQLGSEIHAMERPAFQPAVDDDADRWYWRYVLPSGETLAVSGTGYATRDELVDDLSAVRETAATTRDYATGPVIAQLYGDETWRWRLLDRDREPIARSATAYSDEAAARDAVADLTDSGADAPIFTIEDAAIWLDRDASGDGERARHGETEHETGSERTREPDCHWTLVDRDRNVLATAAERGDESAVRSTIEDVRRLVSVAERIDVAAATFDLVEVDGGAEDGGGDGAGDQDADWRWRLLDEEQTPVAIGADREGRVAARETIEDVRSVIEDASVVELASPAFELYRSGGGGGSGNDSGGDWRWRLLDDDGETLLESTQSYETRSAAREAITALQTHAPEGDGDVTVVE